MAQPLLNTISNPVSSFLNAKTPLVSLKAPTIQKTVQNTPLPQSPFASYNTQPKASVGIKASAPAQNIRPPTTTLPTQFQSNVNLTPSPAQNQAALSDTSSSTNSSQPGASSGVTGASNPLLSSTVNAPQAAIPYKFYTTNVNGRNYVQVSPGTNTPYGFEETNFSGALNTIRNGFEQDLNRYAEKNASGFGSAQTRQGETEAKANLARADSILAKYQSGQLTPQDLAGLGFDALTPEMLKTVIGGGSVSSGYVPSYTNPLTGEKLTNVQQSAIDQIEAQVAGIKNGSLVDLGGGKTVPVGSPGAALSQGIQSGQVSATNPQQQLAASGGTSPGTPGNARVGGAVGSNVAQGQSSINQAQTQQGPYSVNNGLYGQLITGLANSGQGAINNNNPGVTSALSGFKSLQDDYTKQLGIIGGGPNSLGFKQGQGQVLQNQYSSQVPFYTAQLQGAYTGQGQGLSSLGQAAGLAQPVGQFGMLTNPITGEPLNPSLLSGPVAQAVQLVRNGADPQGSAVQSLLAPLGLAGQSMFNQAMLGGTGGGYNPTSLSTQVQTNQSLGSGVQQQNFALTNALRLLDSIQPIATNFLSNSGMNPTNTPAYNMKINQYISTLNNPGAASQWASIMNDIRSTASQIIASKTPGTPTSNDEMTASQDPGLLSANQLETVLNTWRTLGQAQANVYQGQQAGAYGNSGGYTGSQVKPLPSSIPVAQQSTDVGAGLNTPAAQFAAGLGLDLGSGVVNAMSDLGGQILGFLTAGLLKGKSLR